MHELAKSVQGYIRKHDLLRAGNRVGVAVSGGADSVGLLRILLELRAELGIVLSVLHLNHRLRGAESDGDEGFVRELAAKFDLELVCEAVDVNKHATKRKLSLEAAARDVRYAFFERLLARRELDKVATAHTLDDQAETVLLKMARGAGTKGLAGIYPRLSVGALGAIVRPLLGSRRKDVEAYLRKINQGWREDSSNCDLRHTRNRVRHEVLPRLEEHVSPAVRESLAETAEIARAEEEYWSKEIASTLARVWKKENGGGEFDRDLQGFDLAVRRRLVRAAAESLGLNLEFHHVEEILGLRDEGACAALPDGWQALRHKGSIRLDRNREGTGDYEYALEVPGKVEVREAGISIEAFETTQGAADQRYNPEHLLDMHSAARGLRVRNWQAGDRFWPAHTKQPKKIKELLQDRHVTGDEKKRWPVVASGDEVVWLRGFGVRRDFQAKDGVGIVIRESPTEKTTLGLRTKSQNPHPNRKKRS